MADSTEQKARAMPFLSHEERSAEACEQGTHMGREIGARPSVSHVERTAEDCFSTPQREHVSRPAEPLTVASLRPSDLSSGLNDAAAQR
eukprot:CAMPEP_0195637650 /NCGR_PEP_ID=MMETSP0815-20121206/24546_1 /TAXON_ID=97485 /ORGANISM="Prymnesium parvum, Strain Texoma1" /LENGTH=88 /DNA_ID=CAMNT_0040779901 /DNA_START=23 /DNA_END=285 /DNA_ORIENTATION=+